MPGLYPPIIVAWPQAEELFFVASISDLYLWFLLFTLVKSKKENLEFFFGVSLSWIGTTDIIKIKYLAERNSSLHSPCVCKGYHREGVTGCTFLSPHSGTMYISTIIKNHAYFCKVTCIFCTLTFHDFTTYVEECQDVWNVKGQKSISWLAPASQQ